MADYLLQKRYVNHFGLDLKSTDITRQEQYASDMLNAQYTPTGAIEKRKGYQGHGPNFGGFGLYTYNRIDPVTGLQTQELLGVKDKLYRFTDTTLTVSYAGANPSALISIFFDVATTTYRCQLVEGSTVVLDQDLGLGTDEATPFTVADLDSAISAVTGFSATTSGDGTVPAAFLKITRDHDLSATGSDLVVMTGSWVLVPSPITSPFAGSLTNRNAVNFENVSATQAANCMFFANGYDDVVKYDGQNVYRAGLPTPNTFTAAIGAAGSITGTNYLYSIRYTQFDAAGNLIEGNITSTTNLLNPTADSIDLVLPNVLAASGFNTNCAVVNGLQSTVNTITVDAFHTLKVGDTAYFFDGVSASYVEREVTAVGGTTVTVAGAAVTVADNAVMSNNLRIGVYRSLSSGSTPTDFFLVVELPNNSFTATQAYTDDAIDSALGVQLLTPLTDRSAPPKGKYVSVFRNQLVVAGNINFPNTFYWSDIDGPEYFPDGVNSADVDTLLGDAISGISPNNEVFAVFKDKSIHIVSGNIAENQIRVDQLTSDIGCAAHATIQEVKGQLFFLSDRNVYAMVGGQLPKAIGEKIDPIFAVSSAVAEEERLKLKRAVGFNDRNNERYLLYLPTESTNNSLVHPNDNSVVFTWDQVKNSWLKWNNINMAGGMAAANSQVYFSERRYRSSDGVVVSYLYRVNDLNDAFDYQDHTQAVAFEYSSNWEALGEPSVLKRFLKIRIFALDELVNNALHLNIKTEINYIKDAANSEFDFEFSSDGYGVSEYGNAPYGDPAELAAKNRLGQGRVRSLRVRFFNSLDQENIAMTGWELEIAAPFRPGFKR